MYKAALKSQFKPYLTTMLIRITMKTITVGETAPLFTLLDENNTEVALADYIGNQAPPYSYSLETLYLEWSRQLSLATLYYCSMPSLFRSWRASKS